MEIEEINKKELEILSWIDNLKREFSSEEVLMIHFQTRNLFYFVRHFLEKHKETIKNECM